jgi:hypothetical protein
MRVSSAKPRDAAGSTLVIAVVITAIIGISLAAYLNLVNTQQLLTTRSQVWNSCMPVVEAGIEEALTHLHNNYLTNMTDSGWELRSWGYIKTNAMVGTNTFAPANPAGTPAKPAWSLAAQNGYYVIQISSNLPYTILARGFYPLPGATPSTISQYVSRTVRVETQNLGMHMGPFVLRGTLDLNGNNVVTDSYDSRDSSKSTGGRYDPAKAGDKGDVITMGGVVDSKITIGNANVWGHVYTAPAAMLTCGPMGKVGNVSWQKSLLTIGIQPGWWQTDLNLSFPDVAAPFTAATPPGSSGVTNTLGNGNYMTSGMGGKWLVTGDATLYVTGDIKFTGSDFIQIAAGARLKIYAAGATTLFNDIFNPNLDPTSFTYFGLPSNTSLMIKGLAQLYAVVYAPSADVVITGNADMYGSIVANNAKLTGNAAMHYDEALINRAPSRGFIIASWDEL